MSKKKFVFYKIVSIYFIKVCLILKNYIIPMAVPKKRKSSSKRDIRRTNWKKGALSTAKKALSLAKSVIKKLNIEENEKTQS